MTLHNPTKNKIEIKYKGVDYSIDAGKSSQLDDEVATHWVTKIHQFLLVIPNGSAVLQANELSNSPDENKQVSSVIPGLKKSKK